MNNNLDKNSETEMEDGEKLHKILAYIVNQAENQQQQCFNPEEITNGLDFSIHEREVEYLCVQLIEDGFVRDTSSSDGFSICTKDRTFQAFYGKHYLKDISKGNPKAQEPLDSWARSKVFVVHGHNEAMKFDVARTIENLGLEAVILHEQANKGRTIIEKFTQHSDVGFAVVILSCDDQVYTGNSNVVKYRARQNAIFEMGYFIGKIGRERVVAIHDGSSEFEMLSDYDGVLFLPYDKDGKWRYDLAKEMRAIGMMVDANNL